MIAGALLNIFLPIFLYDLFSENLWAVAVYYGLGNILYGAGAVIGAKFLNKFGFRKALQLSVILGALFYVVFYFINQDNFIRLIPLTILILLFWRIFYWLPYHVDFAKFTNRKTRTRQVSVLSATRLIWGVFIPLIAGFIITRFGFDVLFIIAIFLFLVSGIPYLTIPRTNEKFSWSVLRTWKEFISKKRRGMILAYTASGAENFIGLIIWPIFIYQVLKGNYLQVGAISTLIIACTVILQLALGKYVDLKTSKKKVLKWGSVLYSLGWLIKVFIATTFQIFVVGVYHNIAAVFAKTPFEALGYELAADEGHYVDEFTVLREMAIHTGKAITAVLVIIVSFYLSIQWLFILAALFSLFRNLLREKEEGQPLD